MKFIYLSLLFATFGLSKTVAQTENVKTEGIGSNVTNLSRPYVISLGPAVGANFSSLSGDPEGIDLKAKSGNGFRAGLVLNAHFFGHAYKEIDGKKVPQEGLGSGKFGFQLEAMYSQVKSKTDLVKSKTDLGNIDLSYLDVPVLLQYNIPFKENSFILEAGSTFSLLMSSSPDEISNNNVAIHTGDLKGSDLKATFGVAFKSKKGLLLDARYNLGTSDLAGNFPVKTSVISVSLGWLFTIAK